MDMVSYICDLCKENISSEQNGFYCRVSSLESSFSCMKCSAPFSLGYEWTKKPQMSFTCEVCDKVYSSRLIFKYHSCKPSNACQWKECEKSNNHELSMNMNMHVEKNPFRCLQCNKIFRHKSELEIHSKKHSDERSHECDICNKTFKYKCSLYYHMRIHEDKLFQCELCNKTFYTKSHLRSHMPVHSEERPFECSICGTTFKHKGHLKKHGKKHVKDIDPVECRLIDEKSKTESQK